MSLVSKQSAIKFGLVFGGIGLAANLVLAALAAACTPVITLFAGAAAGYFTARQADLPLQSMGGRIGALAGGIAGGVILLGQLVGSVITLAIYQNGKLSNILAFSPALNDPLWVQMFYFSSGISTVACFGLLGVALAALAGAGLGYFSTNPTPVP